MIDFTKLDKPEGLTNEMLQDANVQAFVQGLIDTQKDVVKSVSSQEIERLTKEKVIADQKVADLRGKLDAAGRDKGGDRSNEIEALQKQLQEKEQAIGGLNNKISEADVKGYLTNQLQQYNAKHAGHEVLAGAERHIIDAALGSFRKVEGGDIRAFKGDEPLTGQSGFMTGVEFIQQFRDQEPFFFSKPSGSGANGGDKSGGGHKTITRADFEAMPHAKRMEVAKSGAQIQSE